MSGWESGQLTGAAQNPYLIGSLLKLSQTGLSAWLVGDFALGTSLRRSRVSLSTNLPRLVTNSQTQHSVSVYRLA